MKIIALKEVAYWGTEAGYWTLGFKVIAVLAAMDMGRTITQSTSGAL